MSMPTKLYVGIKAVIVQENTMLLLRREDGAEGPFWDMPGGRMQKGEGIEDTLLRELKEELPSLKNPEIGELLWTYKRAKPLADGSELLLIYYHVTGALDDVVISPEHSRHKWAGIEDFVTLDAPVNPYFQELLQKLIQ